MKASEVMTTPVITARPDLAIKDAARLLAEHDISALPVVDAAGELVGIISEADLLGLETRPDPRHQLTPLPPAPAPPRVVSEVMTREVLSMPADADVASVAAQMLEAHVKRIPILRGRRLVGIVSRHDIIKIVARSDGDIQAEVEALLYRQDLMRPDSLTVEEGVVTVHCAGDLGWRRLIEMLIRTVPGVLDVRFEREPAGVAQGGRSW